MTLIGTNRCGSVSILRGMEEAKEIAMKNIMNAQPGAVTINPDQNDHAMLNALVATLRIRDAETLEHSERVAMLSIRLGREFGLNITELRSLRYGSLLHDIGKI